ncbi:uncharacterized protein [Oryza sativa Japonica Group]|uniref:Disease resistance protein At4g27190-like leucine-rich repeats domain-containing protein n=1 Tax=Oryza sativa subsp. japonica TaxID=39947 RepID=A3AQA2_ORYSJ|nr:uncharacterized protein LOC9269285 isoform X1 [Oryza sativa Japonica Group]EAZ29491.1 hypothetical protein OsJ_13567 [Oryza sativa Japonica Group]
MPADEWTRIVAGSIDEAAKKIIDFLDDTSNNRSTVIYFEACRGLGSSAVLKEVAKRLRSSSPEKLKLKLRLDKIIHVDCSLWQSKRALQKAIAQELELPRSVMAMFDQRDKEDDLDGVDHGARGVIPHIDVQECGVPINMGLSGKRVLWTSQVRFGPWMITGDVHMVAGPSDVAMFADPMDDQPLLHEEAEEVARSTGVPKPGMSPEIVKECIMYYKVVRLLDGNHGIDWATHAANYWVCSGIIRSVGNTSAWEIAQALHTNLRLDWDDSLNNNKEKLDPLQVPCDSVKASFFWATSHSNKEATTSCKESLEARMFQHSSVDRLRVINLSQCTFSFTSPPFLGCSSLRFLLLDRCKDKDKLCSGSSPNSTSAGDTEKETSISSGACFQKLWVLDLSYTDWYWLLSVEAQDLMVELRELNVKGVKHWSISHLLRDDNNSSTGVGSSTKPLGLLNLVKLQVATEPITEVQHQSQVLQQDQVAVTLFPNLSSCKIIKTIILDGCFELTRIDPHDLPPSLESFSFSSSSNDNDVDVTAKIESISFRGCTQLKSVLLRGVFERLKQLDVSGTCIKTLDLRSMRGNWSLKELLLLGCKELRAILWPKQDVSLEVLHIDTSSTELGHATGVVESSSFSPVEFKWYISVRDRRLLRSLNDTKYPLDAPCIEISSPPASVATATTDSSELGGTISKRRPIAISRAEQRWLMSTKSRRPTADHKKLYADVDSTIQHLQLQATMNGNWMWPCKSEGSTSHYISLQDDKRMQTKPLSSPSLPGSICERASGLHVHDSLSVASITSHSNEARRWYNLEWCRVERCPNIEGVVFTPPSTGSNSIFWYLKTFWASQLARARHIWDWSTTGQIHFEPADSSFWLKVLHLNCCPRLIYVLPLYDNSPSYAYCALETLEIVCCGDLKDVFRVDDNNQELLKTIKFQELKHIHLHELPSLQRICGHRIVAPKLETIKIRGCWSLTRLPAVGLDSTRKPKVDCEKEWWDGLQWDGLENGHHPSLYVPTHSRYYKKKLPRGSMLR